MSRNLIRLKKFWKNKKILITGHTGFKGSWLSIFLKLLGAKIYGYSLPAKKKSLYNLANIKKIFDKSFYGDIRNYKKLKKFVKENKVDTVIHLAAQPLVNDSYLKPKYTYQVNLIGTVNLLECIRELEFPKSALIVTTDKVYKNSNKKKYYSEKNDLGGQDPYSNSKACTELICNSYRDSFFLKKKIFIATARAGNIIGGGDFSKDRLIPDFIKSINIGKIKLRYPQAIRPWQHVIEPLFGYLLLLEKLIKKKQYCSAWNFGPSKKNNQSVNTLVSILNSFFLNRVKITYQSKDKIFKESKYLMLDSSKALKKLKWKTKYSLTKSIEITSKWYSDFFKKKNLLNITKKQILDYLS